MDAKLGEPTLVPIKYYGAGYPHDRNPRDRIAYVRTITQCLNCHAEYRALPEATRDRLMRHIERSCYNKACADAIARSVPRNWNPDSPVFTNAFRKMYGLICFRIQTNLIAGPLFARIMLNPAMAKNVALMTSREMMPERSALIAEQVAVRQQQKLTKKISTQHICRRCGGRETTTMEVQIRALDEGSTLRITCVVPGCGFAWSAGGK